MTKRPVVVTVVCCLIFCCGLHAEVIAQDPAKPYVESVNAPFNKIELDNDLSVVIVNAGELLDQARELKKNIILFFDGMPLKEVYPDTYNIDRAKGELNFFITLTPQAIELWNRFIESRKRGNLFHRKVSVSVGIEGQPPIPTQVINNNSMTLVMVRKTWFYTCIVIILLLLGLFIVLAIKTDMLRVIGPKPRGGGRKAYSMAYTQMATWFFAIMSSWLLLYVLKYTIATIPESLVLLMGISAGTGLGGVTIDSNRKPTIKSSQGFLNDILSDANGISFNRFQIFAWTIVMVVVFIKQVTAYLVMPVFDSSLLVLMGISSGTYLGAKISEKPTATEPALPGNPPQTADTKAAE